MFLSAIIVRPAFLLLSAIALVLTVWALVDIAMRPAWAWEASGQNKTLWIVLNVIGIFIGGLILAPVYLLGIRPKVAAAQRGYGAGGAGGAGGYGGDGRSGAGAPGGPGAPGGWTMPGAPPGPGVPGSWHTPAQPTGGAPAGWYPDPGGSGQPRYWDGVAWTEYGPPR